MDLLKVGVLVSGGGTNLQAIIDRSILRDSLFKVALVISNEPSAYALQRAKNSGIPAIVVNHRDFPDRKSFEEKLIEELKAKEIGLICLAGFMRILSPYFIQHYRNKIMNIHPALLPLFGGKGFYGDKVHKAVLDSGMKVSGVTVHFVTEETDAGPIILQESVPVEEGDTVETLSSRIHKKEYELYSKAIQLFAEGRLKIEGRIVRILCK